MSVVESTYRETASVSKKLLIFGALCPSKSGLMNKHILTWCLGENRLLQVLSSWKHVSGRAGMWRGSTFTGNETFWGFWRGAWFCPVSCLESSLVSYKHIVKHIRRSVSVVSSCLRLWDDLKENSQHCIRCWTIAPEMLQGLLWRCMCVCVCVCVCVCFQ